MNKKPKAPSALSELKSNLPPVKANVNNNAVRSSKQPPAQKQKKKSAGDISRKAVLSSLDFLEKHGKKLALSLGVLVVIIVIAVVVSGISKAHNTESCDEHTEIVSDFVLGKTVKSEKSSTPVSAFAPPETPERCTVTLTFYGKADLTVRTEQKTLGEIISDIGLELDESEMGNIDLDGMISEDTTVAVDSLKSETVSEEYQIDYQIKYIDDDNLDYGTTVVSEEGKEGVGVKEYSVTVLNGEVLEKVETADYVKEYPVDRIIRRGSRGTVNIGGELYTYSRFIPSCFTTVYTVWHGQGWTACGLPADESVIAVDPSVIPYHTKVYIEGIGIRIAADCGTAIKGDMIDIYFNSDNPLFGNYGVQYRNVYILK